MSEISDQLVTTALERAAVRAVEHELGQAFGAAECDLGEAFGAADVARRRRPAKAVTALRMDLDVQARLGVAAAQRGIGTSTLMRQIIEEWVESHLANPAA